MKKLLPFFALISLIITISVILDSYAIFETDVNSNSEMQLAKWQILVNGDDITGTYNEFSVAQVNWGTNSNVLPGKASPGLSAYFDVFIDPEGTEVSMDYEIHLDFLSLNNSEIVLNSVLDRNNNALEMVDEYTYKGMLSLADIESDVVERIRVSFTWNDNEENNDTDSYYVNQDTFLNIPVSIKFVQHIE